MSAEKKAWEELQAMPGGEEKYQYYSPSKAQDNQYTRDLAEAKKTRRGRKSRNGKGLSATDKDIQRIKEEALRILTNETIPSTERLIHLRRCSQTLETSFTDTELRQQLWTARRLLTGAIEPHKAGSRLERRKAPFLWQGIVMKEATTLLVSLPKVGKSRLLCQFIGHLHRGESEFLGQPLFGPCPLVLIVGTDQDEGDWAECLHLAGLLPGGQLANCIVALYDKGRPLHLDDAGIETIANYANKHPGLLILLDSYYACTHQLGLMERDANYAGPLVDLQEAISPHKATLLVIHHSKKGGDTGTATEASRGTTALPSQSSWNIALSRRSQEKPLAPQDRRITLKSEGRGGYPVEMLIEQVDEGKRWISHGDADTIAKTQASQELINNLSERAACALEDIVDHWQITQKPMDATAVAAALNLGGENPTARARDVLKMLEKKFLIEQCGERRPETGSKGGKPSKLYRPTETVLTLYPRYNIESVKSSLPSKPICEDGIDGITSIKAARTSERRSKSTIEKTTKTEETPKQRQTKLDL